MQKKTEKPKGLTRKDCVSIDFVELIEDYSLILEKVDTAIGKKTKNYLTQT